MSDVDVRTTDGEQIEVGDTVYAEDPGCEVLIGKVLVITDPEGEGRHGSTTPVITVEWNGGVKEEFDTTGIYAYYASEVFEADELYSDKTLLENDQLDEAEGQGRR